MSSEERGQKFHAEDVSLTTGQIWVVFLIGWSRFTWLAARPMRSTNQIWVVPRNQYHMEFLQSFHRSYFALKPVVASRDVGKVFSDLAATGVGKFCNQLKKTFSLTANLNLPWWEVILFKSINLAKIRVSNIYILNPRKKEGLTIRNFWLPLSLLKLISLLCPIITLLLLDWFPFTCGSDLWLLASFKKTSLLLGRPQDSRINTTRIGLSD